jgi:cell wall-associated NlpC family hydrolase
VPEPFDPTLLAYDLAVLAPDGRLLHLPRGGLVVEEAPAELATVMRCRLPDVQTTEGHMAQLVVPGTPYYVSVAERGPTGPGLASPSTSWGGGWDPPTGGTVGGVIAGGRPRELTRGTIHKLARSGDSAELEVEGSDNLAALLEHDLDLHVEAGAPARQVLEDLFDAWGATLGDVAGPDVELPEKSYRGERAAAILDDILGQGPRQGAGWFSLRAVGDQFDVIAAGGNQPTYWLQAGQGAGVSRYAVDISRMVASVVVNTAVDPDQDADPPEGETLEADGAEDFGGATRIIVRDERSTAEISRLEAEHAIAEHGFPDWTFDHETFDIPYVHKWDRIRISDRLLDGYFFITGVSHDASAMRMHLSLITPEDFERQAHLLQLQTQLDRLKGEQQAATAAASSAAGSQRTSGSALDRIRAAAAPVMGRPYTWGGAPGRSIFTPDMSGQSTDCSGFCAWLAHQLGAPGLPAFTDSAAAATRLIGTNTTADAVPGDLVLYWDGGATQPGAAYPHIAMYLEGGRVIESGGNAGGQGEAAMLGSYRYEIRRFDALYRVLHGGGR